jgi:hypothetical protein
MNPMHPMNLGISGPGGNDEIAETFESLELLIR